MNDARLDKLLWSLRVFKTRPLATAACRAGHAVIGKFEAKPGRDVQLGEVVVVKVGTVTRTLKIIAVPKSRVSAKLLADYLVDLTPPEEYERAKQAAIEANLARERGAGRFNKKDRRDLSDLFDPGDD